MHCLHGKLCEYHASDAVRITQSDKSEHVLRCEAIEVVAELSFTHSAHASELVLKELSQVASHMLVHLLDTTSNLRNSGPLLNELVLSVRLLGCVLLGQVGLCRSGCIFDISLNAHIKIPFLFFVLKFRDRRIKRIEIIPQINGLETLKTESQNP